MVHTAFSCNLQSRWVNPQSKTEEDVAVQQTVEKLRHTSAQLVKAGGKHVQLEFLVRTSEGRFQIQSFPGEAVEDLLARIAYVALMPGHGGLENASVRALKNVNLPNTCELKRGLSCRSDASTSAGSDDSGFSSDSDTDSFKQSEKVSGVRFSGSEEAIFFIADEDKLPEGEPQEPEDPDTTVDKMVSNFALFF